ncbi:MAG: ketol-acid reductoisomerase [Bermanella sp.]|jgi:ketol-acid reductoisomerase
MQAMADYIAGSNFADEWDAECEQGMPTLTALRDQHAGPAMKKFETSLRKRLGPNAS